MAFFDIPLKKLSIVQSFYLVKPAKALYVTVARVGLWLAVSFSFPNITFSKRPASVCSLETKEDTKDEAILFIQCRILYAATAIIVLMAFPRVPRR